MKRLKSFAPSVKMTIAATVLLIIALTVSKADAHQKKKKPDYQKLIVRGERLFFEDQLIISKRF